MSRTLSLFFDQVELLMAMAVLIVGSLICSLLCAILFEPNWGVEHALIYDPPDHLVVLPLKVNKVGVRPPELPSDQDKH